VWIYTGNELAKFHGNILSLSENIAKRFRGATFLTHTVVEFVYHGRRMSREQKSVCLCRVRGWTAFD